MELVVFFGDRLGLAGNVVELDWRLSPFCFLFFFKTQYPNSIYEDKLISLYCEILKLSVEIFRLTEHRNEV